MSVRDQISKLNLWAQKHGYIAAVLVLAVSFTASASLYVATNDQTTDSQAKKVATTKPVAKSPKQTVVTKSATDESASTPVQSASNTTTVSNPTSKTAPTAAAKTQQTSTATISDGPKSTAAVSSPSCYQGLSIYYGQHTSAINTEYTKYQKNLADLKQDYDQGLYYVTSLSQAYNDYQLDVQDEYNRWQDAIHVIDTTYKNQLIAAGCPSSLYGSF